MQCDMPMSRRCNSNGIVYMIYICPPSNWQAGLVAKGLPYAVAAFRDHSTPPNRTSERAGIIVAGMGGVLRGRRWQLRIGDAYVLCNCHGMQVNICRNTYTPSSCSRYESALKPLPEVLNGLVYMALSAAAQCQRLSILTTDSSSKQRVDRALAKWHKAAKMYNQAHA